MDNGTVSQYMGHIYWLAVLAEQGSYTAAATRLNVSKSAVSQRLSELERVAGIALVRRTTRSVRLTEAGQQLVDMTQQARRPRRRSPRRNSTERKTTLDAGVRHPPGADHAT